MKERDVFAEHPSLLRDEFRSDMMSLLEAEQNVVAALLAHIREHTDYESLVEEKSWVHLAEATRTSIDELLKLFRPVRYLALAALKEKAAPDQLLSALVEKGVLRETSRQAIERASEITSALLPILEAADAETPPKLPGLRIQRMSTSVNLISEFENEFDASTDEPDSYEPIVQRLYAYTTLNLDFRNDEHESITIALAENHLKQLIRWLQLAEVQQKKVKADFVGLPISEKAAQ